MQRGFRTSTAHIEQAYSYCERSGNTGVRETPLLFDNRHRHLNPFVRQVVIVFWQAHDPIGDAKAFGHLTKHRVFSIEEGGLLDDNEKLRPRGVRLVRSRHRHNAAMRGMSLNSALSKMGLPFSSFGPPCP